MAEPLRVIIQGVISGEGPTREDLLLAIEHRTVTGQATGILMERFKLDADAAFQLIVNASQTRHTKVYDLAVNLVKTGEWDSF